MPFSVDRTLDRLAGRLLPARCVLCRGRARERGLDLCPDCADRMPRIACACPRCGLARAHPDVAGCASCEPATLPYGRCHAAYEYGDPVAGLIQSLKYGGRLPNARVLGTLLGESLAAQAAHHAVDLLLPMPLHPSRLAERGYNQSVEIARWTARRLGLEVGPGLLVRLRATRPQVGLSLAERRSNLSGAFAASAAVCGRRVALLDDVVTTGSTVREAAQALRAVGAASVDVWCVARTPPGLG